MYSHQIFEHTEIRHYENGPVDGFLVEFLNWEINLKTIIKFLRHYQGLYED